MLIHKNKIRKQVIATEEELELTAKRKSNPLSVEDLLRDNIAETAFPNVRRLMKVYVLILCQKQSSKEDFLRWDKL